MKRRTGYPYVREAVAGVLPEGAGGRTPPQGCLHEPLEPRLLLQAGPTLSLETVDAEASEEGSDPGVFRVTLDAAAEADITANFRLGGTARRGTDYDLFVNGESLSGLAVTIPAGQTAVDITVVPIDDLLVEQTEIVALALRKGADYDLPSQRGQRVGRIELEDNEPFVMVTAADLTASEANCEAGMFRIARDRAFDDDLVVPFRMGGTARLNRDFQLFVGGVALDGGAVVLPAGASFVDVAVVPLDDTFVENTEIAQLALVRSGGFAVSPILRRASVDLVDDEPKILLSSFDTDADEECRDPAFFRISREGSFVGDVTVPFRLGGTARFGDDFDLLVGDQVLDGRAVVIPDGDPFVDVIVRPVDDAFVEPAEFVAFGLGSSRAFTLDPSRSLRVVRADLLDNEPELTITTLDGTTGDFGVTELNFRVSRSSAFDVPLTTPLLTSGTARFNRDFQLAVGDEFLVAPVVTIPTGDPFVDIVVVPSEDNFAGSLDVVRFGLPRRSTAFTTDPGLRVVTVSV
ncbi:MAG: hypothetical protein GX591_07880 [Planctomycetes bacterium]|nr:hypothetical protein [Planctomycetota bacterium]